MKKFTSTSKKVIALSASVLLTGALVAGCIANNDVNPAATPQPNASSTDTGTLSPVTPEPSASATPKAWEDMNEEERLNETVKYADPAIASTFGLSEDGLKRVVAQSTNTYRDLAGTYNFRTARPEGSPADSVYISDQFSDRIAGSYLPTLRALMDTQAPFPTVNRDGHITIDGVAHKVKAGNPGDLTWITYFDRPGVSLFEFKDAGEGIGPTHGIRVAGNREDIILLDDGRAVTGVCAYSHTSVPATAPETNTWLIAGIGCMTKKETVKVLTVDETNAVVKTYNESFSKGKGKG